MPTVLTLLGWRVFFYSNEGNEPVPVHARKGDAECKFWVLVDEYDLAEEYSHNLTLRLRREIRKILFDHFDLIVTTWEEYFGNED